MAAYTSVPPEKPAKKSKRQRQAVPSKRQRAMSEAAPTIELAEKKTKGFQANARKIARKQGLPLERAQAILAAGTRRASAAAKKKNPALKRVKGKAK